VTWPRRTPDGRTVPEIAALLCGRKEALALGLDLTQQQQTELGWSMIARAVPVTRDQAPDPVPALVQEISRRNVLEKAQALARRPSVSLAPDIPRPNSQPSTSLGQPDTAARGNGQTRGRKVTIADFLKESADPDDEEWSS
jgi:hypothetical protein